MNAVTASHGKNWKAEDVSLDTLAARTSPSTTRRCESHPTQELVGDRSIVLRTANEL